MLSSERPNVETSECLEEKGQSNGEPLGAQG
jgi:hypothetical protein